MKLLQSVCMCFEIGSVSLNESIIRMCREILDTCVRNTEEAERNSKTLSVIPVPSSENSSGDGRASASSNVPAVMAVSHTHVGGGKKRGVWGLIEESELAKSIQKDEVKKVSAFLLFFFSTYCRFSKLDIDGK